MVNKVIAASYGDNSDDDLVQHIYLTLLEMDNEKLNYLYSKDLMGPWIMQIILNNRNYYRSKYQIYFTMKDHEQVMEEKDLDEDELVKLDRLDFLDGIIGRYNINDVSGYTVRQKWEFTSLELLKLYINRGHSFTSLGKSMKMSKSAVNETLKYAREFIKNEYKKR